MNKPIAIVFSDIHLNIWSRFNTDNCRTNEAFKTIETIARLCTKYKVPALFCGDLIHKPEVLEQDLANLILLHAMYISKTYPKFKVYAISGNHDMNRVNSFESISNSWVRFFSGSIPFMYCLDFKSTMINYSTRVYGVPYIDHNIGLYHYLKALKLDKQKKNILLLHTDYPGAKDTDGRVVDSAENININMLNKFDLVLSGHIHKPQRLGKKIYMIGSPMQQKRTDKNCKMGIWILYDNLNMKFQALNNHVFIDVESEDDIKDDGNYYTVIPKVNPVEIVDNNTITKKLSKSRIARKYLKIKGITDINKKNLLINTLKKAEE